MTYAITWDEAAINAAAGFLSDDAPGIALLFATIDELQHQPRPADSGPLGSDHLRRLHAGRYRAIYEIDDTTAAITVIQIGRRT